METYHTAHLGAVWWGFMIVFACMIKVNTDWIRKCAADVLRKRYFRAKYIGRIIVNNPSLIDKLCLPPLGSGDILFSPGVRLSVHLSVRLSVCLSVTNCVRSVTWKPLKLYSRNFIQISISIRWRAECMNGNSAFSTFWVISFELCASQKSCRLYNLKTTQAIFTKLYTNINQHEMMCRVQEW